jgi:carbohydrate diacid regulator
MLANQVIQASIDDLKAITKVELAVYDFDGIKLASTAPEAEERPEIIHLFADSVADSQVIGDHHLLKVQGEGKDAYVVSAVGSDDNAYMVARIAVSQLKSLLVAYREKYDHNSFFQNLLLDNLLLVDIYNRAQRLRIKAEEKRVVFLIETRVDRDNGVVELLKSLFSQQNGDHVVLVDEKSVVLVKNLHKSGEDSLEQIAQTIVDMLNTEAMMKVRVSYGTVVNELRQVSKSYKEARMALDVGKIFYADKMVIGYTHLGIGRLIYQLPVNLCRMFMEEIFGDNLPDRLDEETLATIYKFFENSLNVSETARQLYIHRNTLVYRIEKLQKETGLDIRNFDDALTFKIALMVVNYLNYVDKQEN